MAGSKKSATSLLSNTLQKQADKVQEQISSWETKMGARVDYYTRQFTALEQLINTMNNQSGMFAGLMGG
jgi:flagellar hook-associated protein 2